MLYSCVYDTPLGKITITADENHIKRLDFGPVLRGEERESELISRAHSELMEYLSGRRRRFTVPLSPEGTEFQQKVWSALCEIPFGETRTYGEIAAAVGNMRAARAVGMACNRNPIAIMIPCHRVLGSGGELTGYASGLETKAKLLDIEKRAPRHFKYGERELNYLKSRDEKLARLIDELGFPEYEVIPDLFEALVYNIIGQQISIKAADGIWRRVLGMFGDITPERIASASIDELQSAGLSKRKAEYIRSAAESIVSGALDIAALKSMPDDEVIKELTKLRGVGKWTAEMLLIFSLERPDVFSRDDFGLRRGLCKLHSLDRLGDEIFEHYRRLYSPYCSVASFYLWQFK